MCWSGLDTRATISALRAGRTTVQSACLYLDWGWTWDEFMKQDVTKGMTDRRLGRTPSVARSLLSWGSGPGNSQARSLQGAPSGLAGGEGAAWAEQMDASNIDCKLWPRMGSIQEKLWSGPGARSAVDVPIDPTKTGKALPLDPDMVSTDWLGAARASNEHKDIRIDDAARNVSVLRIELTTSNDGDLSSSHSRYAAWRDLITARGMPAAPLNNQWVKPEMHESGKALLDNGKDPSAVSASSLVTSSALREAATSTAGAQDHAKG